MDHLASGVSPLVRSLVFRPPPPLFIGADSSSSGSKRYDATRRDALRCSSFSSSASANARARARTPAKRLRSDFSSMVSPISIHARPGVGANRSISRCFSRLRSGKWGWMREWHSPYASTRLDATTVATSSSPASRSRDRPAGRSTSFIYNHRESWPRFHLLLISRQLNPQTLHSTISGA